MTTRGITFSNPMVLALLAGEKTQTRRLLYCKRPLRPEHPGRGMPDLPQEIAWDFPRPEHPDPGKFFHLGTWHNCQAGDRLYVREALGWNRDTDDRFFYRADGADVPRETIPEGHVLKGAHCPPHLMPRWASRLCLSVTRARLENLSQISRGDAVAEGVMTLPIAGSPTMRFMRLWSGLHDREGERVDDNPAVVVLEFTVRKGQLDGD